MCKCSSCWWGKHAPWRGNTHIMLHILKYSRCFFDMPEISSTRHKYIQYLMRYHTTWWDTIIYTNPLSLSCLPLHMLRLSIITLGLDFWVISWVEFRYKYNWHRNFFFLHYRKSRANSKICLIHWEFWSVYLQLLAATGFFFKFYTLFLLYFSSFDLGKYRVRR